MIVWRRKGFVIAVVTFGCLFASDGLTARHFQDHNFYATHGWPKLTGFLVAAAIVWALSYRRKKDETLGIQEDETPRHPFLEDEDSLFFIPARYWPGILGALGVLFFFIRE
jgi:hypothetical protein